MPLKKARVERSRKKLSRLRMSISRHGLSRRRASMIRCLRSQYGNEFEQSRSLLERRVSSSSTKDATASASFA